MNIGGKIMYYVFFHNRFLIVAQLS